MNFNLNKNMLKGHIHNDIMLPCICSTQIKVCSACMYFYLQEHKPEEHNQHEVDSKSFQDKTTKTEDINGKQSSIYADHFFHLKH